MHLFLIIAYLYLYIHLMFEMVRFLKLLKEEHYTWHQLSDSISYILLHHFEVVHLDFVLHLSRDARKPVFGVRTRSDTNGPVQTKKQVRSLKFQI